MHWSSAHLSSFKHFEKIPAKYQTIFCNTFQIFKGTDVPFYIFFSIQILPKLTIFKIR